MSVRHLLRTRRLVIACTAIALPVVGLLPISEAAAIPPSASVVRAGPEIGAERSVPGYATAARRSARVERASGRVDTVFQVATPVGSAPLSGDWDGDGASTPATFTGGSWTLWNTAVGRAPTPATTITGFGATGDQAVTGDWNGDGRTDIGVYRDGVFTLGVLSVQSQLGRRDHLHFGLPGDVAVVGDWDGDGKDDVGVRRGDTFYLRTPAPPPLVVVSPSGSASPTASPGASPAPTPPPAAPVPPAPGIPLGDAVIRYGSASDEPVAGDWDGDGKDTVGVVRGATWYLRDDLRPGPATTTRAVGREAGSVPLPWRSSTGDGTSCPYAAAKRVVARGDANADLVVEPYGLHLPMPGEDVEGKVRTSLLTAERYLMNAGHTSQTYVREPWSDPLQRTSRTTEEAIRLPAMRAATLAIGLSTQAWDPASLGSTEHGTEYVAWLVRTIACTHASMTPGGWGYGFQTAHWAMLTAMAAWLVWDDLQPQEREYVATMLVGESDFLLTQAVQYQFDRAGGELSPGDTRAEEDSWNAAALQLAVEMMPDHPRADLWRRRAVDLAAGSFARAADVGSSAPVNGVALSARLGGSNAAADGSVVNNAIITGDYISTVQQNWWSAAFAQLGQTDVLEAALTNADPVWAAMTANTYTRTDLDGTVTTSAIYREDGQVFFPQGSRWGTVRRAQFVSLDAFRLLTVRSPEGREAAWTWLDRHIDGQLALQARSPDGRTFLPGEDNYPGREEYAASQVAFAWLALYIDAWQPVDRVDRAAYSPLPVQTVHSLSLSGGLAAFAGGLTGVVSPVGAVRGDRPHPSP